MSRKAVKGLVCTLSFLAAGAAGPFEAASGMIVAPSLSGGVTYDSNAFLRSESANQEVGGDLIFTLTPQVAVENEGRRVNFRGAYSITGAYYLLNPETNSIGHSANAGVEATVTRKTVVTLRDYFRYSKESMGATALGIRTEERDVIYNDLSLDINQVFTSKTTADLQLASNLIKFRDPMFIDTRTDRVSGTLNYEVSELTAFSLAYTYSVVSFESESTSPPIYNHAAELGMSRRLTPTLEMNLTGGAMYRTGDVENSSETESQLDWIGHLDIVKTFAASTLNIGYTRYITTTSGLTDSEGITERYVARYTRPLTAKSDIAVFGEYTNHYSKPESVLDIQSLSAGINSGRRINKWLTMSVGFNHFQQFSRGAVGNDISSERVFLNFTAVPEMRKL